jgi:hypothetical protein
VTPQATAYPAAGERAALAPAKRPNIVLSPIDSPLA